MNAFHPQMLPFVIIPTTFLFVLSVILVAKAPKAGAWLVGALAFLFPLLVVRAAQAGMFATPMALPLFIMPMTFLFVLLVVLISKLPKAGACIVGGLVLLFPTLVYWGATAHAFVLPAALPMFIIPTTFLFILVVVVLSKTPKAGAGLAVALVLLLLFGLFFGVRLTSERGAKAATATLSYGQAERIAQSVVKQPGAVIPKPLPPEVIPPTPPLAPAPIWSSGVDTEMNADVYPSESAALRAASDKLGKSIRAFAADANALPRVVVFQEAHPYRLIVELRDAIRRALPEVSCNTESESRPATTGELVVTLSRQQADVRPAPWARSRETTMSSSGGTLVAVHQSVEGTMVAEGQLDINLSGRQGKDHIALRFTEKPWIEDFATFVSARPGQAFIIARSQGACTSESEAALQAVDDARARLTEAIGQRDGSRFGPSMPPITANDVRQGGFIVDTFAQSLEGSAARVWRQALLLDVSGPKLAKLTQQKAGEFRQVRMSWARMMSSAVGVLILIGAIYFFLNMATRGYYEWSLRIASVVLALVAVISILMVVK